MTIKDKYDEIINSMTKEDWNNLRGNINLTILKEGL
jgi:hypothetical protein